MGSPHPYRFCRVRVPVLPDHGAAPAVCSPQLTAHTWHSLRAIKPLALVTYANVPHGNVVCRQARTINYLVSHFPIS